MSHKPPRLAEWLLRRHLPLDRENDAIRGDLLEEYRRRSALLGVGSSKVWYWRETLSLIVRGHGHMKMITLDNLRQDIRFA